jgi:hypothetical protein
MSALRTTIPVAISLLSLTMLPGCSKLFGAHDKGDAGAATVAAIETAPSAACTAAGEPFAIDANPRLDTGLTMVKLTDGRVAVGYAVGDSPKVAVVDAAGKATIVDVDFARLKSEGKADKRTVRTINRVTPLGFKGLRMRVGVDLLDITPVTDNSSVRTRHLRCGPADQDPIIGDDGPSFYDPEMNPPPVDMTSESAVENRDCRTFTNGERTWVLASKMFPNNETGDFSATWIIDEKPGKQNVDEPFIDSHEVIAPKDKSAPKAITYDVPVSVEMPNHGGFVLASRYLGQLVVGKRAANLERSGDATRFNFGTPVGMAALVVTGSSVALFVSEAGKTDLLGTTFTAEAIPTKPEKIVLSDPKPPTEGDRASVSASATDKGDLVVGFTDGKGTSRRARVTLLGADLKPKVPVFDITADANISELRVGVLPDGRILATYIEIKDAKPVVTGMVVSCKY